MRVPVALGVDFAAGRSDPTACLGGLGLAFACRYLAPQQSAWKVLTREEAERLSGRGLNIITVYQYVGNGPQWFTPARAREDAAIALELAAKLGQPPGTGIYFAVDFDARQHLSVVAGYLREVRAVLGGRYRLGVYGSFDTVEFAAKERLAELYWQTYAWSGGRVSERAHLYQWQNGVRLCEHAEHVVDLNYGFSEDPGWWRVGGALRPRSPVIPPLPVKRGDRGYNVLWLQHLLRQAGHDPGPLDGVFGPKTEQALRAWQASVGLESSGSADRRTWETLLVPPVEARLKELEQMVSGLLEERRQVAARLREVARGLSELADRMSS